MTTWLSEVAALDGQSRPRAQRAGRRLRAFDLALALPLWLLVALPAATLVRYWASVSVRGRDGLPCKLRYLNLPSGVCGRILRMLGARHWPTLLNILRGDMGFVGPRPRAWAEARHPPPSGIRPGLVSPWFIRQRTGVDFVGEEESDGLYQSRRGLRHDVGILLRAPFVALLPPRPAHLPSKVTVANLGIDNLSMGEAVQRIGEMLNGGAAHHVCFVNAASVNEAAIRPDYGDAVRAASLVLPDGIGMRIGSYMLGMPLMQNVNGTDLFPRLAEALNAEQATVYLLGGRPGVAAAAAAEMGRRWPGLRVVGHRDGYFSPADASAVVKGIRLSGADLLFVGMGVPAQDIFINRHLSAFQVKVAIGVGGLFDYISGSIERAPLWMRETGLEWVWRLALEPRRLWRRYLVGNVAFLARVLKQRTRADRTTLRSRVAEGRPRTGG